MGMAFDAFFKRRGSGSMIGGVVSTAGGVCAYRALELANTQVRILTQWNQMHKQNTARPS